ncbi:CPCC family cysteine-rich protein [Natronoglycomyces albus]|uniref:CPCC family cysteine-rich protein n=1 Tax=Natronoglycomyces albus TaxID=2811108 RepID=UPI0031B61A40
MICLVCWWQDDPVQLRWPTLRGGANKPSLVEAQKNYRSFGAYCQKPKIISLARSYEKTEEKEEGFRNIDLERDNFESEFETTSPWPNDWSTLYWWRTTYWRL